MEMATEISSRNGISPQPSALYSQAKNSENENLGKGGFWTQYKALVIRNFILKLRERRKTFMELFMPLYFIFILAMIRLAVRDTTYEAILEPHGEADVKDSYQILNFQTLHVTPNTTQVARLMEEAQGLAINESFILNVLYYDKEEDIINIFKENDTSLKYAVVFPEDPILNKTYTIRLDPLHVFIPSASARWADGSTCREINPDGSLSGYCPANNYFFSGFLGIQTLIDTSIIRLSTGKQVPLPEVTLQNFPKGEHTSDGTVVLRSIVPLYLVFAWAQFIVYMMMLVVEEKEKRIKEGMKIMGLRDSVYWLSWFTIYGVYVLLLSVVCIIVLPLAQVFRHANIFLLFLLFILYGCSSIVFALMMTPFFNKAKVAGIVGNLTQVAFSLLYYLQVYLENEVDQSVFWALGIFSPCAFSLALDKTLYFDFSAGGLTYDKLWEGPGLPFAGSLIMISIDIVLYLSLAYYLDNVVPSEYGTKRKPWFIFQKSFWVQQNKEFTFSSLSSSDNSSYDEDEIPDSPHLEPVSSEFKGKTAVRIRHLKKTFYQRGKDPVHAVDGISLDIYEGQITAILGHNGAGKTTLFNILTGMTSLTSGAASIFGLDISDANDLTNIRRITGVCPQHDIIFMTLTPREHLNFFARIRGIPPNRVDEEVEKTLREVDLFTKADAKGADLSGGQKRKLSIGIALIGDPRIIFLDEPTAGVDAYSRRHLWTLLRNRKAGKVILLTTHFMDEADILADRKAIVSKGKLRCCGSSLFLKNKFGLGYHLTLVIDEKSDGSDVSRLLQDVISKAQLARHYGKEMSFILPSESSVLFPQLFSILDERIKASDENVGIEGYGISMTTLEEVFLTLSDEHGGEDLQTIDDLGIQILKDRSAASALPLHHSSASPALKAETTFIGDAQGFAVEAVEVSPSTWRSFKTMLKFRAIVYFREPAAIIFLIVMPLIFTSLSIFIADRQSFSQPTDTLLPLNAELYGKSGALLHNNTGHGLSPVEATLSSKNVTLDIYDGSYEEIYTLRPHMTAWMISIFPDITSVEDPVNMTMGFNDTYTHSIPILMNLLNNALLSAVGSADTIQVFSQMLPSFLGETSFDATTFFAPMLIGFTFTLIPAGLGIEIVNDREIGARNMLRLNGVGFNLYFSSFFLVMGLMYMISYIGLLIIIAAFGLASLTIAPAFAAVAILYLLYLPSALLYSAVFCYMFDKAETARQFYPSIATTLGFMGYTAVAVVDMTVGVQNGVDVARIIHIAMAILLPHYIPFGLLYYINRIYLLCSIKGDCSSLTSNDYMTAEIIIMFIMVLVDIPLYYIFLRLADTLKLGGSWKDALWLKTSNDYTFARSGETGIDAPPNEDDDVIEERANVSAALMNVGYAPPVLIYDLGKVYESSEKKENPCKSSKKVDKKFVALKSVSLEVKAGQVFGLLGPNGAGKTTSLRIMTAQESPSKGRVRICGKDVISSLSEVFGDLGYCPQHDVVWRNLTVAEHIECIANIRGVRMDQVKPLINSYLKGLEIEEHRKKYSQDCSGGTKRKLSYILSMIGSPKVVLLDEPSTGMDPQSKRFLWNSILASFKGERSAILTTHSMEEADALCARIGILVRGGMRCIGAIQHLKNKYGGGYSLELKLNPEKSESLVVDDVSNTSPNSVGDRTTEQRLTVEEELQKLVMATFPSAVLDEQFEERMIYKIPQDDVTSLSGCFEMLEKAKGEGKIQEYALSQTTLEQVFLQFARQQEQEDSPPEDGKNMITEL